MPKEIREEFASAPLPSEPTDVDEVYAEFRRTIVPYVVGNTHPGFMGWVHGGGTAVGMLAEMLAAGLNANCGGRDHSAIEVNSNILQRYTQSISTRLICILIFSLYCYFN